MNALLNFAFRFVFLAYFLIAFLIRGVAEFPGQRNLVTGFVLLGVPGLLRLIADPLLDELMFSLGFPLTSLIFLAGVAFIVTGVWRWSQEGSGSGAPVSSILAGLFGEQSASRIPRNTTNSVSRAEEVRDEIAERFEGALQRVGVDGEIFTSPPYSPDVWVRLELSMPYPPRPHVSLRTSARVEVTRHPFHTFEHLLTVTVDDSKRTRTYRSVIGLSGQHAERIVSYLADKSGSRRFGFEKARVFPFQLWRPKQKLDGVNRLHWYSGYVALLGFVALSLPPVGLTLLLVAVVLGAIEWRSRRRFLSLTTGKPEQEPRILLRMDSWQTVLQGIGEHVGSLRSELLDLLRANANLGLSEGGSGSTRVMVDEERAAYVGIDGKVQRDQIVVRLGRAIVFLHLHPYDRDLYIGWDAHLNGGTWTERLVARGVEPLSGLPARAYGIVSDWHSPNEYDIADANFLLEWVHSAVTRVAKKALRDHQIDQEIDFTIVREARQSLAGSRNPRKEGGRFRRVS